MGMAIIFDGSGDPYRRKIGGNLFGDSTNSGTGTAADPGPDLAAQNQRLGALVGILAEDLTKQRAALAAASKEMRDEIADVKALIDPLEAKVKTLNDKIEESSTKSTEILAVFVGLFTFVSIDFQIFKSITEWNAAAGLVLMSGGIMASFIALTDMVISTSLTVSKMVRLAIVVVVAGVCVFYGQRFFKASLESPRFAPQQPEPSGRSMNINTVVNNATSSPSSTTR